MKKTILTLSVLALLMVFSSCGVNSAFVLNHNQHATQVHLAAANYRVVSKVSGRADVSYVLIFGGLKKKQLYANAYADMVDTADLESGARALVNVVTEEHLGGFPPFYYKRTVTVSAQVIEFTR